MLEERLGTTVYPMKFFRQLNSSGMRVIPKHSQDPIDKYPSRLHAFLYVQKLT